MPACAPSLQVLSINTHRYYFAPLPLMVNFSEIPYLRSLSCNVDVSSSSVHELIHL